DYLREVMGEAFTAKDFRTWGGTVAAMRALAVLGEAAASERECSRQQVEVVREVASLLGKTPSVCRKAYIDPCVFDGWRDGSLGRRCAGCRGDRQWEQAALAFLRRAHRRSVAATGRPPALPVSITRRGPPAPPVSGSGQVALAGRSPWPRTSRTSVLSLSTRARSTVVADAASPTAPRTMSVWHCPETIPSIGSMVWARGE